jgi:outer membrane protein OmpA-like peptidoglycan-associated protein
MNIPRRGRSAREMVDPDSSRHEEQGDGPSKPGDTSRRAALTGVGVGLALLLIGTGAVASMVSGAKHRLTHPDEAKSAAVAVADDAEASYCTPGFKQVLQRVLNACGLVGTEQRRGCQPADVKTFASISDADFNALFTPLKDRGAVLMFDDNSDVLDTEAKKLLDEKWLDRKGARYFFVVARASKDGTAELNRALSHKRANSVLFHLKETFQDPDLDNQVGLLWLGSEFAQLSNAYCDWPNSRSGKKCTPEAINRSAFASWVDCRL